MNRLAICLLIALALSLTTGVTVIVLQQRTISDLRGENEKLHPPPTAGADGGIPPADFPGHYRWLVNGVERGFITLNADNSAVGLSGKNIAGGTRYRWFYQGGQLALTWGVTHALVTECNGPGHYSGTEGNKPVQMIREP